MFDTGQINQSKNNRIVQTCISTYDADFSFRNKKLNRVKNKEYQGGVGTFVGHTSHVSLRFLGYSATRTKLCYRFGSRAIRYWRSFSSSLRKLCNAKNYNSKIIRSGWVWPLPVMQISAKPKKKRFVDLTLLSP